MSLWKALLSDESGQGTAEYAIVLAIVTVGIVATLVAIGNQLKAVYNKASAQINTIPTS